MLPLCCARASTKLRRGNITDARIQVHTPVLSVLCKQVTCISLKRNAFCFQLVEGLCQVLTTVLQYKLFFGKQEILLPVAFSQFASNFCSAQCEVWNMVNGQLFNLICVRSDVGVDVETI